MDFFGYDQSLSVKTKLVVVLLVVLLVRVDDSKFQTTWMIPSANLSTRVDLFLLHEKCHPSLTRTLVFQVDEARSHLERAEWSGPGVCA